MERTVSPGRTRRAAVSRRTWCGDERGEAGEAAAGAEQQSAYQRQQDRHDRALIARACLPVRLESAPW